MQFVWFIALVAVLIAVHELGHYVVARLCGVKVLRLSLGFGPALVSMRRGETEYAIAVFPLGGYVRLLGENPGDEIAPRDRARAFPNKPLWQRLAIVLAGPAANLALPVLLYFHLYAGETTTLSSTVGTVLEGQPADGVLQPGDRIVAIDDVPVATWDDVNAAVSRSPSRELRVTFERAGQERPLTKVVTPRAHHRLDLFGEREIVGQLGITPRVRLSQIGVGGGAGFTPAGSPAARAGLRTFDVITSVQGRPVESWRELEHALAGGRGEAVLVTYLRPVDSAASLLGASRLVPGTAQIFPVPDQAQGRPGAGRYDTGLRPAERFLASLEPGSPADRAGLRVGDEIIAVDGAPVRSWEMLSQRLDEHPERPLALVWRTTTGEERSAQIDLMAGVVGSGAAGPRRSDFTQPSLGAESPRAARPVREVPLDGRLPRAAGRALASTAAVTVAMVRVFVRLVTLRLPASSIGGLIRIYEFTGAAAARGSDQLLLFLAVLSINLALLNLLPIPLLDGGVLLFFVIEGIRRRPLTARQREIAVWIGLTLLAAITLLAVRNDLVR